MRPDRQTPEKKTDNVLSLCDGVGDRRGTMPGGAQPATDNPAAVSPTLLIDGSCLGVRRYHAVQASTEEAP